MKALVLPRMVMKKQVCAFAKHWSPVHEQWSNLKDLKLKYALVITLMKEVKTTVVQTPVMKQMIVVKRLICLRSPTLLIWRWTVVKVSGWYKTVFFITFEVVVAGINTSYAIRGFSVVFTRTYIRSHLSPIHTILLLRSTLILLPHLRLGSYIICLIMYLWFT